MTYDTFAADERTRDAVIRNIEIIGEAAGKLPKEVTAPQIPWRLICDMRHVGANASRSAFDQILPSATIRSPRSPQGARWRFADSRRVA